jgi:Protein of unknown function (DUF3040)
MTIMAAGRLTEREQRILDEMEAALDRDHGLSRRLRGTRGRSRLNGVWAATGALRVFLTALAAPAALVLLVVAVATSSPAVIWAFAATWTCALLGGRTRTRRRTERHDRM